MTDQTTERDNELAREWMANRDKRWAQHEQSSKELLERFNGKSNPMSMEGMLKRDVNGWWWEEMGVQVDVTSLVEYLIDVMFDARNEVKPKEKP